MQRTNVDWCTGARDGVSVRSLEVRLKAIASLRPRANNPRTHSKRQIRQIADSIGEFGFTNPLLIDTEGRVIAGHGRLAAARLLGIEAVPTIQIEDLSEAQVRAYVIADNKLAENAGWDQELLAIELEYLCDLDVDIDVGMTGFEAAEIDLILGSSTHHPLGEADEVPPIDEGRAPVTRHGDIWVCGRHRLLCADARHERSFRQLLGGKRAELVFTDPPYNVAVDGHVCGRGAVKHREFAMAAGEMSEVEYTRFLQGILGHLATYSADGSIHFVCMDWRHMGELLAAGNAAYSQLKNLCVWNKDNGGMGSLYRSKHELVFVFKSGTARHTNNIELGRHGRYRTNVWDYAGISSLGASRDEELAMHPTVKPVALVADAIQDCSHRGGIVLDCFGGSGTTMIAAEQTGRRGFLIELDPVYVDVAVERFERLTGEHAVLEGTGASYAEVKRAREVDESETQTSEEVEEREVHHGE